MPHFSDLAYVRHLGRFVEFQACGVYYYRLGKELPDGSIAWLELHNSHGDITAESMARGLRTQRKLEAAVSAARFWKEKARRSREITAYSMLLGGTGILSSYLAAGMGWGRRLFPSPGESDDDFSKRTGIPELGSDDDDE